MAKNTDRSYLQMKMLNTAKGPGVQCLRAQIDKILYTKKMIEVLEQQNNIEIIEEMVSSLKVENNKCVGVITDKNSYLSKCTILTTGTYMESTILVGHEVVNSGLMVKKFSVGLSDNLRKLGVEIFRLKNRNSSKDKKR